MPQFGLGNFYYEVNADNGKANFKFTDPFDTSNTAEVSVAKEDFPEENMSYDSRQVADIAYDQCQRVLNEKRDARILKEEEDAREKKNDEDAKTRQAAQDFQANAEDTAVAPAKVEKDGTHVYNTENNVDAVDASSSDSASDKKKK